MHLYSESFAHEDYFMQLARRNGEEIGTIDPSPAVGNYIKFLTKLLTQNQLQKLELGLVLVGYGFFKELAMMEY